MPVGVVCGGLPGLFGPALRHVAAYKSGRKLSTILGPGVMLRGNQGIGSEQGNAGRASDQRGLWEADRLYLDHVEKDTLHGLLASLTGHGLG